MNGCSYAKHGKTINQEETSVTPCSYTKVSVEMYVDCRNVDLKEEDRLNHPYRGGTKSDEAYLGARVSYSNPWGQSRCQTATCISYVFSIKFWSTSG